MARRRHTPEEIIHKLREAEVALSQGKTVGQVCKQLEVTEQTYYRWRKESIDAFWLRASSPWRDYPPSPWRDYPPEASPLRYDAIVIDEGQDFKDEYWLPIEWLLRDPDNSHLYVFYDQNQALYTRAGSMPITEPPFVLSFNCRNTQRIHEAAYRYFRGEATDGPTGNDGAPVASLLSPSVSAQAGAIHAAVVALLDKEKVEPQRIAVLVCGEPKEQFYQAIERTPLPRGCRWVVEGAAADRGVRLETVRRFKGLEADIVYLWGADCLPARDQREMLYVGTSRAKSRLIVVGSEEACTRVLSPPRDPLSS